MPAPTPTLTRDLPCPEATLAFGQGLALCLRAGDVLLLEGELGAGKTTLLRALATTLGADAASIASPTYVLMHSYALPPTCPVASLAQGSITHVDAYRITSDDDLDALGWDLVVQGNRAKGASILCVEWPSRIASSLPSGEHVATLTLSHSGGDARTLHLALPAHWHSRPELTHLLDKPPTRCRTTGTWVSPLCPTWPFSSAKAQAADLYGWLSGSYRISREVAEDDDASDVERK
jgi:tRNA threonylcarbamoyl adenosine modification protein YjeE